MVYHERGHQWSRAGTGGPDSYVPSGLLCGMGNAYLRSDPRLFRIGINNRFQPMFGDGRCWAYDGPQRDRCTVSGSGVVDLDFQQHGRRHCRRKRCHRMVLGHSDNHGAGAPQLSHCCNNHSAGDLTP